MTTSSLPALKAYLVGEQAFRVGEYRAAEAFQQAVGQDSLFALAYYRLAAAAEYAAFRSDIALQAMENALRYSDRLSSRDRALVDASLAVRRGDANEAERLLRSYLGRYPTTFRRGSTWASPVSSESPAGSTGDGGAGAVRSRHPLRARQRVRDAHLIRLEAGDRRIAAMDSRSTATWRSPGRGASARGSLDPGVRPWRAPSGKSRF